MRTGIAERRMQSESPPCAAAGFLDYRFRLLLFRSWGRNCIWKDAFDGRTFFFFAGRIGKRLAGNHLIAHRRVVDEDRLDRGDLLEVGGLEAFDHVLV